MKIILSFQVDLKKYIIVSEVKPSIEKSSY